MKHMLLTTALVSLITAMPLSAQTAETTTGTASETYTTGTFVPPAGYTPFEPNTLTVDDLQGATVYDANGQSVGDISDFVFAGGGATGSATGSTTGAGNLSNDTDMSTTTDTTAMTDHTTTDTDTGAGDMTTTGTATDMAADSTAETGTGMGNATDTTAGTDMADDMADTDIDTDLATDLDADGTDLTDPDGTGFAAVEGRQEVDMASGEISHVVLDVGGFLGIGTHTVAVPMEELQVFRDEGNNLRVYLPWTEAQLEALPEYDEDIPGTLDATDDLTAPSDG